MGKNCGPARLYQIAGIHSLAVLINPQNYWQMQPDSLITSATIILIHISLTALPPPPPKKKSTCKLGETPKDRLRRCGISNLI